MAQTDIRASDIANYYGKFFKYKTNKPCKDSAATNQCAVRLSIALEGLSPGFLDDFNPANRVHRDRPTCPNLPPHVLGAAELGVYITYKWGLPYGYHGTDRLRARDAMQNRVGVVWFEKCYSTSAGVRSDHIDFWNGWHCMNELLYESAGGGTAANADLFSKSDGAVRFFELLV